MNVYLPINGDIEDLVNTVEALKPGTIQSRQVLEVSTEDKSLAMLLKKLSEGVEDEFNAPMKKVRKPRKARIPEGPVSSDGGEL